MGFFDGLKSFFGGKTQTTTTGIDPASQAYLNQIRQQSQAGANTAMGGPQGGGSWFSGPQSMSVGDQAAAFFNPYMSNVIDATRGEFDNLRSGALNSTRQQATLGGGFGGSRMAVLAGSRLGELDRGQASTIGGMLQGGYNQALSMGIPYFEQQRQLQEQQTQEPLWRAQMAQNLGMGGMGPYGQTTTMGSKGGGFQDLLKFGAGAATTAIGAGWNPFGGGQPQTNGMTMPNQFGGGFQPNLGVGQPNSIFQNMRPGNFNPQFQYRGPQ